MSGLNELWDLAKKIHGLIDAPAETCTLANELTHATCIFHKACLDYLTVATLRHLKHNIKKEMETSKALLAQCIQLPQSIAGAAAQFLIEQKALNEKLSAHCTHLAALPGQWQVQYAQRHATFDESAEIYHKQAHLFWRFMLLNEIPKQIPFATFKARLRDWHHCGKSHEMILAPSGITQYGHSQSVSVSGMATSAGGAAASHPHSLISPHAASAPPLRQSITQAPETSRTGRSLVSRRDHVQSLAANVPHRASAILRDSVLDAIFRAAPTRIQWQETAAAAGPPVRQEVLTAPAFSEFLSDLEDSWIQKEAHEWAQWGGSVLVRLVIDRAYLPCETSARVRAVVHPEASRSAVRVGPDSVDWTATKHADTGVSPVWSHLSRELPVRVSDVVLEVCVEGTKNTLIAAKKVPLIEAFAQSSHLFVDTHNIRPMYRHGDTKVIKQAKLQLTLTTGDFRRQREMNVAANPPTNGADGSPTQYSLQLVLYFIGDLNTPEQLSGTAKLPTMLHLMLHASRNLHAGADVDPDADFDLEPYPDECPARCWGCGNQCVVPKALHEGLSCFCSHQLAVPNAPSAMFLSTGEVEFESVSQGSEPSRFRAAHEALVPEGAGQCGQLCAALGSDHTHLVPLSLLQPSSDIAIAVPGIADAHVHLACAGLSKALACVVLSHAEYWSRMGFVDPISSKSATMTVRVVSAEATPAVEPGPAVSAVPFMCPQPLAPIHIACVVDTSQSMSSPAAPRDLRQASLQTRFGLACQAIQSVCRRRQEAHRLRHAALLHVTAAAVRSGDERAIAACNEAQTLMRFCPSDYLSVAFPGYWWNHPPSALSNIALASADVDAILAKHLHSASVWGCASFRPGVKWAAETLGSAPANSERLLVLLTDGDESDRGFEKTRRHFQKIREHGKARVVHCVPSGQCASEAARIRSSLDSLMLTADDLSGLDDVLGCIPFVAPLEQPAREVRTAMCLGWVVQDLISKTARRIVFAEDLPRASDSASSMPLPSSPPRHGGFQHKLKSQGTGPSSSVMENSAWEPSFSSPRPVTSVSSPPAPTATKAQPHEM